MLPCWASQTITFITVRFLLLLVRIIMLKLIAEDQAGTQVLEKFLTQFILFNPDDLWVTLLCALILVV